MSVTNSVSPVATSSLIGKLASIVDVDVSVMEIDGRPVYVNHFQKFTNIDYDNQCMTSFSRHLLWANTENVATGPEAIDQPQLITIDTSEWLNEDVTIRVLLGLSYTDDGDANNFETIVLALKLAPINVLREFLNYTANSFKDRCEIVTCNDALLWLKGQFL